MTSSPFHERRRSARLLLDKSQDETMEEVEHSVDDDPSNNASCLEETIISGPTFATARKKMRSTNNANSKTSITTGGGRPYIHLDEPEGDENDSTLPSETPLLRLQNTPKLSDCTNQRRSIHLRKVEATASPTLNEQELSQGPEDKENNVGQQRRTSKDKRTPRGKTRAALGGQKVRQQIFSN